MSSGKQLQFYDCSCSAAEGETHDMDCASYEQKLVPDFTMSCFRLGEGERMVRCSVEFVEELKRAESAPITIRITEDMPTGELRFVAMRHDCPNAATAIQRADP
jgi:hypothetical protein